MDILFATTNPAKVNLYKEILKEQNINLLSIKDLDFKLEIDENGKDAIENAKIKAKAYYKKTGLITIGMDDNLYIEELPKEKQPGTYVRRINGKELTDEEMIVYYSNLAKEYGGKLTAKWVYGMVIYTDKEIYKYSWSKDSFNIIDTPSEKRRPGYPLDSISKLVNDDKYFVDIVKNTDKKKTVKSDVIDFILTSIFY